MNASLEISMYPLDENYGNMIVDFIQRLKQYEDLRVLPNRMSTQLIGDYDRIMEVVTKEMKTSFLKDNTVVTVMKIVNLEV